MNYKDIYSCSLSQMLSKCYNPALLDFKESFQSNTLIDFQSDVFLLNISNHPFIDLEVYVSQLLVIQRHLCWYFTLSVYPEYRIAYS